jgi:Mce-associated membrane protein
MKPKIKIPAPSMRLALVVVTALAVAAVVWQGLALYRDRQEDARRDEAVAVARDQVLDLTTLDSDTIDEKLAAMAERLSGDFKRQFDGFAQTFADVVKEDEIRATGEVEAVAVDQYDGDSAVVLVATSAEIAHGKSDKAAEKSYRMRVDLDREGDRWLITGMEFVG